MEYFKNAYQYKWSNTAQLEEILFNYNAEESQSITFSTPQLFCWGDVPFRSLFEMNVKTTVYRTTTQRTQLLENGTYSVKEVDDTKTAFITYNSGATSIPDANNDLYYASEDTAYLRKIRDDFKSEQSASAGTWLKFYTYSEKLSQVQSPNDKTITLSIPALTKREIESGIGYKYEIECIANPINTNALFGFYEARHIGSTLRVLSGLYMVTVYGWGIKSLSPVIVDLNSVKIATTFYHKDMSVTDIGGPFTTKGVKYSAYELLRKALLTTDTQIIDNNATSLDEFDERGHPLPSIQYSIVVDDTWNSRLQDTKVNETIFEGKNLWEVLLQIGYYLHAIPYLEFATDSSDRFVLKFQQLGDTSGGLDNSVKITVFNSRNLSEYFTQYDSYVTNLFSPQNLVDEWVVPKTSGNSYLVSNNTAELQLSKGITEILKFDIYMKLPNGKWDNKSALENIFEKSIYDILSNDNPYQVYPVKGSALYYTLGDNKIQGLNFVPPSVHQGDLPMALKRIIQLIWQGTTITNTNKIKFNSLCFHIQYRTQDSARISQLRPDLESFVRNSSYEKYPHHEQFYGQQDKIVDSERFSANLFGKLVRVGNNIFQRQEYAMPNGIKESGNLVQIGADKYYVMVCENEFYPDIVLQKITYSKNFNQLANIVTIPSEPRFYEVSERSKVRREVRIMEFLTISTTKNAIESRPRYLNNSTWKDFIKNLIFNESQVTLPNYAWTRFKADKHRPHWEYDKGSPTVPLNELFPSSLLDRSGSTIRPSKPSDHADCIVPLLHFPMHDGITFTWDMVDNFKAGDFVDNHIYYNKDITEKGEPITANDDAYLSMQPMRYVDIKGRADLFSFKLFNQPDWSFEQTQKLPLAIVDVDDNKTVAGVQGGESVGIGLDKDGREELSFNYQINLLHKASESDSEDFITFPNLFGQKSTPLTMCFLKETQSLFNENVNVTSADMVEDNVDWKLYDDSQNAIELRIEKLENVDMSQVKSIVLYEGNKDEGRYAYIVKNVATQPDDKKSQSWWIYPTYNL